MKRNKNTYLCRVKSKSQLIMKKASITLLFLLLLGQYHAQVAQWIVPPLYDNISFASGADIIVSDSANAKVYWSPNGQRLFSSTETVNSFSDGYAVVTNDTSAILGYYDTKGHYTSLASKKIKVANDFPYFTDGYLVIKKKRHYIVDSQGIIDKKKYLKVYPFHNGYAVCSYFENPKKHQGIVNYLIDQNKSEVTLKYNDKTYKASEVDFISSVNDENIGFVVIKKAVYIFNANNKQLSPLYFQGGGQRQAKLAQDLDIEDGISPVIYAQCGKNEQIIIYFDKNLVPLDIYYNNEKHHYTVNSVTTEKASTPMKTFKQGDLYGLLWKGQTVLPAQFDAIQCYNGDLAFAWQAGKQGLLKVSENAAFTIGINNDKDIAFRHQTYETKLRIDMPADIDPSKIDIQVDPNSGYVIDKLSKQTNKTSDGNRAEYTCTLTIPNDIKEIPMEFVYPIQINCDNIKLLPSQKKVKAWRDNYYDVVIKDSEKTFDKKNNTLSFPFTINAERFLCEETIPFEVSANVDSWAVDVEQSSPTQGVCTVQIADLNEGENYLYIELTEEGCPPVTFTYIITNKKPGKAKKDFTIKKDTFLEID